MEYLPDELLITIFQYTIENVYHLLKLQTVCQRFYRIANNSYLWYWLYRTAYPSWSTRISYMIKKRPLIDWKSYIIRLAKKKSYASHLELTPFTPSTTKKRLREYENIEMLDEKTLRIQEPFVYDIDPVTHTGIVAMGNQQSSEHKILFLKYPSYELVREMNLKFSPSDWSCQILGIQTIRLNERKVQLFALVIGMPVPVRGFVDPLQDGDDYDRINKWRAVLIYHLMEDGTTECLANIPIPDAFLGRGIYFFSSFNNGNTENVMDWLQMISPDTVEQHDPHSTVFMLAFGVNSPLYSGCGHIIQFDLRGDPSILDPSETHLSWDEVNQSFYRTNPINTIKADTPHAKLISSIRLGSHVSCMIHFRHPPQLNHLMCVGSLSPSELTIYDWRFGIKVGSIPRTTIDNDTQPWGCEYSWSVPVEGNKMETMTADELWFHGLRLIAVGDREDKFEIKIWDISDLLNISWTPFNNSASLRVEPSEEDVIDMSRLYSWWVRGTTQLKQMALDNFNAIHTDRLPYNISPNSVLIVHTLDTQVKYTAYNISQTSLYLLTHDGDLAVMDVESGQIIGRLNIGIGIDINVLCDNEMVITQRKGLSRCLLTYE
ncbi:hypothetical protein BDB01DRAFT_908387 [Pilobolus umbonatus]|nr:hypothetical protein BDB01DRAFT_908387 [Pilobolus umbonatus]